MLEAPPQQCLSYCLAMLSCNASNFLVLHCTSFLLHLGWAPWLVAATCQAMLCYLVRTSAVACRLPLLMQQTQRGVLACILTRLNNVSAELMQQHAFKELQSRSRARMQVGDLPFHHKAQLFPNEDPSTAQVGDVAITWEGRGGREGRGVHSNACYLEKVGDIFVLQTHGLGAAEGGIGCHMDPLLLAPLNSPVIAPVAMDFHLHMYCCSLATLLCCFTMKSARLQRTQAPASLQTPHCVPAALYSSWPTSVFMQNTHIANSSPAGNNSCHLHLSFSA